MVVGDRVQVVRYGRMQRWNRPSKGSIGVIVDVTENNPNSAYNGTAFVEFYDGRRFRVPVSSLALATRQN